MPSIDEIIKARFVSEQQRCIANIMYTTGWIRNIVNDSLKPYGLSSQQFNILRILRGADNWVAMTDIKELMVEKAPNTTRLVDKLLDKGLLERKRSEEDRRVVYAHISKKGLELLAKIDANENPKDVVFMSNLSTEDAKLVSNILDKMRG